MNADTVKAIGDALKPLADKIGQGGAHVYEVFTRQQYVVGVGHVIIGLVLLLLAVIGAVNLRKFIKWDMDDGSDGVLSFFLCLALLAFFFIGLAVAVDGVMHILSPEYYAIQDIMCQVKKCE